MSKEKKNNTPDGGMVTRSFTLRNDSNSINEEKRTVEAVIATEAPAVVYDWNRGAINEILLADGIEMPGTKQIPLLNAHSRYSVGDILGSARNIRREDNTYVADLHFSTVDEAEKAWTLAREGHLTDVSIGYTTSQKDTVYVEPKSQAVINDRTFTNESDKPLAIRKKWVLRELSTVPIGADKNAKLRADNEDIENDKTRNEINPPTKENKMDEEEKRRLEAEEAARIRAEAAKIATRTKKAEEALQARGELLGLTKEEVSEQIRAVSSDGIITEDGETRALEQMFAVAESKRTVVPPKAPEQVKEPLTIRKDEFDNFREAVTDAMCVRGNIEIDAKRADALAKSEYNNIGLLDTCRAFLKLRGVNADYYSPSQVYDAAVEHRHDLSGRAFTVGTGDLSNVFLDVANKALAKGWSETLTTYQILTGKEECKDFRAKNIVKISSIGGVEELHEGEGFPMTTLADSKEVSKLLTFGLGLSVSRKAIINDDLGALTRVPAALAASMKRHCNREFYKVLYGTSMAGTTMGEDSKAMFHADHGNFVATGSGAAPSSTTISNGKYAMSKQTALSNGKNNEKEYLGITPSIILYNGKLEQTVFAQINSTYLPDVSASINHFTPQYPYIRSLIPVSDPVLDELMGSTHSGWYLLADPKIFPAINTYTLLGNSEPTLRSKASDVGEALGTAWDVYYDCGFNVVDFRAAYANFGK